MSQQSFSDLNLFNFSQGQGGSQEAAFQSIWNGLSTITDNGEFTQLLANEPHIQFSDENVDTDIAVSRLFIPVGNVGHQDTITELFGGSQVLQNPDNNPVSPDSQTGSITPQNGQPPSPITVAISSPVSNLPSNNHYPGPYGFEMTLGTPPQETKATTWTYSKDHQKLFARIAVACPFKFRCVSQPPNQCLIRAMPIYAKPEHVLEVVKRCPNHTHSREYQKDNVPTDHFVRCDNSNATFCDDPTTGRQSVVVPLESNEVGDDWKTYLYQFMCNNSCAGGINRRPVQVIFTLESFNGEVLGRRVIDVRICACPGRDRKYYEKTTVTPTASKPAKKSKVTVTNEFMTVGPAAKRPRLEEEEVFTLTIRGRENYEMLLKIRDSLELASSIPKSQLDDMKGRQAAFHKQVSLQRIASIPTGSQPSQSSQPQQQQQAYHSPPQQLSQGVQVPLSQGFSFLGQGAYQLPSLPSQPTFLYRNAGVTGMEETDGGTPITSTSPDGPVKTEPDAGIECQVEAAIDTSVDGWLKKIGMTAYGDNFRSAGYTQMFHLDKDHFTMEDLNKMKIGTGHRNKIWKALLEYRDDASNSGKQSQDFLASSSRTSTLSIPSQNSGISPGYFEVTKYTFRHTITRKGDHDYCHSKESS